jgi:hypothetical protein
LPLEVEARAVRVRYAAVQMSGVRRAAASRSFLVRMGNQIATLFRSAFGWLTTRISAADEVLRRDKGQPLELSPGTMRKLSRLYFGEGADSS